AVRTPIAPGPVSAFDQPARLLPARTLEGLHRSPNGTVAAKLHFIKFCACPTPWSESLAPVAGGDVIGRPPRRTVRAAVPRTALTSSRNGKCLPHAFQRIAHRPELSLAAHECSEVDTGGKK